MGLPQPLWSSVLLIYHLSSPPKLITHPQSFYKSWNQRNNLKFWTNYPKYNKISTKKKNSLQIKFNSLLKNSARIISVAKIEQRACIHP